jgi:DNA-binding PadR family transcriptional regulator
VALPPVVRNWIYTLRILMEKRKGKAKEANLKELLPLTPAMFEILVALADSERHGYAIMQEVEHRTEGRTRIGPGTLYRSIQRLMEEGLITESDERPASEMDDERRRYYRMTDLGYRVAVAEARRLAELVSMAQEKKLLPKTRGK